MAQQMFQATFRAMHAPSHYFLWSCYGPQFGGPWLFTPSPPKPNTPATTGGLTPGPPGGTQGAVQSTGDHLLILVLLQTQKLPYLALEHIENETDCDQYLVSTRNPVRPGQAKPPGALCLFSLLFCFFLRNFFWHIPHW